MDLESRLKELESQSELLETSTQLRDEWTSATINACNSYLDSLESLKSYSTGEISTTKFKITGETKNLDELLTLYFKEVAGIGIKPASGGHLGYIPGGGIYPASLGDYLAATTNVYAGMAFASAGAVTLENACIDWMKGIFGFPESAIGNLTSGGSIANLTALTAARDAKGIKNEKIQHSVIYLTEQINHSLQKALRIIGLEDVILRYIKLDSGHRLDPSDLKIKIEHDKKQGLNPFLVIATAGTTETGAMDPLDKIADISAENDLWFHIDAAYGGFFILVDALKEKFAGIEKADSLVVDPHKGLFLPFGLGAVLVKNKDALFQSHHYSATYMQDSIRENALINPADISPELSKHFRGVRMWLPLQLLGVKPFIKCLEEKLVLTEYFRLKLKERGFEVGPEPDLSVSYFWYPNKNETFTKELMEAIHADGDIFLSSSNIDGRFVIRMAILSFRTKKKTIDKALDMIDRCLKSIL